MGPIDKKHNQSLVMLKVVYGTRAVIGKTASFVY